MRFPQRTGSWTFWTPTDSMHCLRVEEKGSSSPVKPLQRTSIHIGTPNTSRASFTVVATEAYPYLLRFSLAKYLAFSEDNSTSHLGRIEHLRLLHGLAEAVVGRLPPGMANVFMSFFMSLGRRQSFCRTARLLVTSFPYKSVVRITPGHRADAHACFPTSKAPHDSGFDDDLSLACGGLLLPPGDVGSSGGAAACRPSRR